MDRTAIHHHIYLVQFGDLRCYVRKEGGASSGEVLREAVRAILKHEHPAGKV